MMILALDLSLSRTGWAALSGDTVAHGVLQPPRGEDRGVCRLRWFCEQLRQRLNPRVELAVIEGYAYGTARGASHAHSLGELGGVVRLTLHYLHIPFVEVPPASLKKYAVGKGNAGKAEVLVAAVKRLGYAGADDNEADALWLLTMARDQYGEIESPVPKAQREGLAKVQWPQLQTAKVA
jgi:Holliday junction resolvasome RuvABC endonuclease subunit